jgi:hypothetical protein
MLMFCGLCGPAAIMYPKLLHACCLGDRHNADKTSSSISGF